MLVDIGSFGLSRHAVSVASPQAATPGDYPNSRDRYICLRITNYGDSLYNASQQFIQCVTAIGLGVRWPAPLWVLARAYGAPMGARAGARAAPSIPAPPAVVDGGPALDPGRRLRVGRRCQKRSKIGHQGAQRRYPRQLVVLAREMRAGARPRPVFGTVHQPRDYRIGHD